MPHRVCIVLPLDCFKTNGGTLFEGLIVNGREGQAMIVERVLSQSDLGVKGMLLLILSRGGVCALLG